MLPFGTVPDDDTEAPAKRTEDIAAATPPRARRFSLGRVLLLVFLFVLVAGILYFVEELIVERRVVAACDRISDLAVTFFRATCRRRLDLLPPGRCMPCTVRGRKNICITASTTLTRFA